MFYRARVPGNLAMKLTGTPKEFYDEWTRCWDDHDRDLTALYLMAQPFLRDWERQLTQQDTTKDLRYQGLCSRLESTGYSPSETIRSWVYWCEHTTSVSEELELLFFRIIRVPRFLPRKVGPERGVLIFANYFKGYLQRAMTLKRIQ